MSVSGARRVGSSEIFRGIPRMRTMIQMGLSWDCWTGTEPWRPRMGLGRKFSARLSQPREVKISSSGKRIFESYSARVISSVRGASRLRIRSAGMDLALA